MRKNVFSLDKYGFRNMGWKLCFCYSTYRKQKTVLLKCCIQYAGNIRFNEHVKLVELETLHVIVGSYGQNAYLAETMKHQNK